MAKSRVKFVQHAWRRDADGRMIRVVEDSGGPAPSAGPGPLHPVLSVVVPAYGRADLVAGAVASVRRSLRWNCAEVVVVDDASPEPIVVPGARVHRLEENAGFGRACDAGAALTSGAFLLFLNSDAALQPGCAEELLEWAHRGWDVVGPRLLYPDGTVQHGGFYWDADLQSHVPFGKRRPGDAPEVGRAAEVDAVSGACLLVRRTRFESLGGFGGEYGRGYYEDVDLCLRAWEAGARVLYAGAAAATHWESQSFGDFHRSPETRAAIDAGAGVFRERWPTRRLRQVWEVRAEEDWPTVDVVVTAHGASDRVAACLRACAATLAGDAPTGPGPLRARLLVVDDASPPGEAEAVAAAARAAGAELLRLDQNVGYRRAAEAGIAATSGEWFVLLNSDTVPTAGWLAKLLRAGASDPKIAVVNPLTNNAADLGAPFGRGRDLEAVRRAASAAALGEPVDVAYPVGFCLMVRRRAWVELGGFDGEAFPEAYGEETDLCERALQAGWRCVLEPSAFVYHEGKASHGARAFEMEQAAVQAFLAKHGATARQHLDDFNRRGDAPRLRAALARARPHDARPGVVFYLPELNLCGGVLACYHLARRLSERHGWRATIATRNLLDHEAMFHAGRLRPLQYESAEQFAGAFATDPDAPRAGALVATAWFSARSVVDALARCGPEMKGAYFVQDDEAMFAETDGRGRGYGLPGEVHGTYAMLPHLVANSPWVAGVVREHGAEAEVIPVGVDHELFRPRPKYDRFTVLAMCRHTTPRRGYDLLAEVYERLRAEHPDARLLVYGQVPLPRDQRYMEHLGTLPQHRLADVMGRCHVLVEPSQFQGFGLPALEAMASGCVPVSLDNRGIHAYGEDGRDCRVVAPAGVAAAVSALRADPDGWAALARAGRETALKFTWDIAAARWDAFLRRIGAGAPT